MPHSRPRQLGLAFDPIEIADRPAFYYASGSNLPGEIRGLAEIGHPIGVAVDALREEAVVALEQLAGRGIPVFVDSGAFSEVDLSDRCAVVRPITDAMWRERLARMDRLAVALGAQLAVVAPDRIGSQEETLARLATYRVEVQALRALGATVLAPLQRGSRSLEDFYTAVTDALGFAPVPAFPCKKAATSPDDVVATMRRLAAHGVRRCHLLGLGAKHRQSAPLLARLAALRVIVTQDSCLIRSAVGKGKGDSPAGMRRLTRADQAFRAQVLEGLWRDLDCRVPGEAAVTLDYTDAILDDATTWLSPAARRRIVQLPTFPTDPAWRRLMLEDPTAALGQSDPADDEAVPLLCWPLIDTAMDAEWARFVDSATTQARKSYGVQVAFRDDPGAAPRTSARAVSHRPKAHRQARPAARRPTLISPDRPPVAPRPRAGCAAHLPLGQSACSR